MEIKKEKLRVLAHKITKAIHSEITQYKDCMESPHRIEDIIAEEIAKFFFPELGHLNSHKFSKNL